MGLCANIWFNSKHVKVVEDGEHKRDRANVIFAWLCSLPRLYLIRALHNLPIYRQSAHEAVLSVSVNIFKAHQLSTINPVVHYLDCMKC